MEWSSGQSERYLQLVEDLVNGTLVCERWSAKTLASELCLHLARRLEPGNSSRGRLIERGNLMSALAVTIATTLNGTYNIANSCVWCSEGYIESRLLDLRNKDNALGGAIVNNGNISSSKKHHWTSSWMMLSSIQQELLIVGCSVTAFPSTYTTCVLIHSTFVYHKYLNNAGERHLHFSQSHIWSLAVRGMSNSF